MKKGAGHMKYVLLLVVIIGLGAVIGAIVVGEKSFEGIVVKKPYEEGLKRDEMREAHKRLGWKLELTKQEYTVGHAEIGARIHKADDSPLTEAEVKLLVSRPNTNEYDKSYSTHEMIPGVYRADVELPVYGYWELEFTVRKGKEELGFDRRVFAEQLEPK